MRTTDRKVGDIHPYAKNAKKHPKEQVDRIAASIREFGFNQPVVVDKDGVIIVGHGRWAAALQLGLEIVPTLELDLTEEQAKAYRLADNKLNESDWDMDTVIEELKGLSSELLDLTGFSADLILEDDDNDDVVPAAPAEARTEPGDVYQLGDHILVCGDSTAEGTYQMLLGGSRADMVFTDPPYNVNYSGSGKNTSEGIMNDHMTDEAFGIFLGDFFAAARPHAKGGGAWYVFHSPTTQAAFEQAMRQASLDVITQLIWNKPSAGLGMNAYRAKHEPFFYAGLRGETPQFYGDRTHTSIVDLQDTDAALASWAKKQKRLEAEGKMTIWTMKRDSVQDYVHPTQKPVELITYALSNSSKMGDLVLDPFGGSGSTLIACEKAGRHARLIELDPKYCDVIVQRYLDYTGRMEVLKNGIPEEWELSDNARAPEL